MPQNTLDYAQPRPSSRIFFLPLLSGVLGFLSFPSSDCWYLAWFSYSFLVLYISFCRSEGAAAAGGFATGIVQFGGLLSWVPSVMQNYGGVPRIGAFTLYGLLVCLQSIFPAVAAWLARRSMNRWDVRCLLLFPIFWVASEYAETAVPFGGFPWLLTGYSQTRFTALLQCADMTGVWGISFLVIWTNVSLAWSWIYRRGFLQQWGPLASSIFLLACATVYGNRALKQWDAVPADREAAMLQQNLSAKDPIREMEYKFRDGYLRMAETVEHGAVDLLILPESPSPLSFQYDESYRRAIQSMARRSKVGLVFNNIAYEEVDGGFRYLNSAYVVDRNGRELGRYDKVHLVPFGEYIPLKKMFFFVESISKDVSDFYPGASLRPMVAEGHSIGTIICFEAVFPGISRSLVRQGAELLINLSNDAWYGDSAAPFQHLSMARWRAVENRRFMLRSTNSGITAVITPTGRITASTGLFREEICRGRFAFLTDLSLYSRCGNVAGMLCAIITFLLCGAGFVHGSTASSQPADEKPAAGSNRR